MTEEQRKKYLDGGGIRCLYCGEYDIEQVCCEGYDDFMSNIIQCLVCNKQWRDILDLVDVIPEEA